MRRLSSTSALVLLWAGRDCYRTEAAGAYLDRLDLREGRTLYKRCNDIWPHYDEVIVNRKFGVLNLIERCRDRARRPLQVMIAGAGLDALGIEVTQRYADVNVFEIDRDNMDLKARLVAPRRSISQGRIAFVTGDLLEAPSLCHRLVAHGWAPAEPTLLVLEGISYYLPPQAIRQLIEVVAPDWAIFESLKHNRDIAADRSHIARDVFGLISSQCALPSIWRYDSDSLGTIFDASVATQHSMHHLEKLRTGANRRFPTESSGWIDVSLLAWQRAEARGLDPLATLPSASSAQ